MKWYSGSVKVKYFAIILEVPAQCPYEGDRVQWARAEAEMDRFQEQVEIKLTEFLRCIASFEFNAQVWTQMGASDQPGFKEQAKETTHMWLTLAEQCRKHLKMAGYQFMLKPDFDFTMLIAYIEEEREKSDMLLTEAGIGQSRNHFLLYETYTYAVPRDKRTEAMQFANARGETRTESS